MTALTAWRHFLSSFALANTAALQAEEGSSLLLLWPKSPNPWPKSPASPCISPKADMAYPARTRWVQSGFAAWQAISAGSRRLCKALKITKLAPPGAQQLLCFLIAIWKAESASQRGHRHLVGQVLPAACRTQDAWRAHEILVCWANATEKAKSKWQTKCLIYCHVRVQVQSLLLGVLRYWAQMVQLERLDCWASACDKTFALAVSASDLFETKRDAILLSAAWACWSLHICHVRRSMQLMLATFRYMDFERLLCCQGAFASWAISVQETKGAKSRRATRGKVMRVLPGIFNHSEVALMWTCWKFTVRRSSLVHKHSRTQLKRAAEACLCLLFLVWAASCRNAKSRHLSHNLLLQSFKASRDKALVFAWRGVAKRRRALRIRAKMACPSDVLLAKCFGRWQLVFWRLRLSGQMAHMKSHSHRVWTRCCFHAWHKLTMAQEVGRREKAAVVGSRCIQRIQSGSLLALALSAFQEERMQAKHRRCVESLLRSEKETQELRADRAQLSSDLCSRDKSIIEMDKALGVQKKELRHMEHQLRATRDRLKEMLGGSLPSTSPPEVEPVVQDAVTARATKLVSHEQLMQLMQNQGKIEMQLQKCKKKHGTGLQKQCPCSQRSRSVS